MVWAKRVIALSFWVNRNILRGIVPDPNTFLAPVLQQALLDYPVHDDYIAAVDTADKPDKFSYEKWVDWQDSVITFLRNTKSVNRSIPLYYIIRKEPNPIDPADMTEEDDIIYNAQHSGAAFNIDNKRVHTYLKELTNGTVADQWINQHKRTQNGKGAWTDLCDHYDGAGEGDKRITVARSDINIVHYRNESTFSFEQCSTRLRKAFQTLHDYKQGKCEAEKVDVLLNQINSKPENNISNDYLQK